MRNTSFFKSSKFLGTIKIGLLVIILAPIFVYIFTPLAHAESKFEYTVLAPLPCIGTGSDCSTQATKTTLATYLPGIFRLAVGIAAVFAVMMIIFGGFQYISTDAIMKKEEGKKRILNSIYGLVLVIGAWLILNTINPNLLNFNLNIDTVQVKPVGGGGALGGGLRPETNEAYVDLATQCNCTINVTSTTEGEHDPNSTHYQGLAMDIGPDGQLTNYLTGSTDNPPACKRVTKTLGGHNATFLWEPTGSKCGGAVASNGDHWHMSVTP